MLDKLRTALGIPIEVYTPPYYGAVVETQLSGAVQLARLGPATYESAKRANPRLTVFATYSNRAKAFQAAGPFYHALLVVRADSGLADIESLKGKRLALVDPQSTSGFLVPNRVFAKQIGKDLHAYFGEAVYSGSHTQAVKRLLAGQVDAAFVGSQNLAWALAALPAQPAQVRVLWRSAPLPADPFVLRGELCDSLKEKKRGAFLERGGETDYAVLANLNVVRFVPVSDRDYQVIRDMR